MNTLNRRIRRIGLLPTTYKEITTGEREVKNEAGDTVKEKITKKVPIRHSLALSSEERAAKADELRVADRARHLEFRAARKAAKKKVVAKKVA